MDENFIRERLTQLRLKKNVSEYKMSLDLGHSKSYIQKGTKMFLILVPLLFLFASPRYMLSYCYYRYHIHVVLCSLFPIFCRTILFASLSYLCYRKTTFQRNLIIPPFGIYS